MEISEIDTRCPHERNPGLRADVAYDDHRPLTRGQLIMLLDAASTAGAIAASRIQVRLNQAIPGMTCPRPIEGSVARKMNKLDALCVRARREGKLTHPGVVDKFWELIQPAEDEKKGAKER